MNRVHVVVRATLVLSAATMLFGAGNAIAATRQSARTGSIRGKATRASLQTVVCVRHRGGALYEAKKCARGDRKLTVVTGKTGAAGKAGAPGAAGTNGSNGANGINGVNGTPGIGASGFTISAVAGAGTPVTAGKIGPLSIFDTCTTSDGMSIGINAPAGVQWTNIGASTNYSGTTGVGYATETSDGHGLLGIGFPSSNGLNFDFGYYNVSVTASGVTSDYEWRVYLYTGYIGDTCNATVTDYPVTLS